MSFLFDKTMASHAQLTSLV